MTDNNHNPLKEYMAKQEDKKSPIKSKDTKSNKKFLIIGAVFFVFCAVSSCCIAFVLASDRIREYIDDFRNEIEDIKENEDDNNLEQPEEGAANEDAEDESDSQGISSSVETGDLVWTLVSIENMGSEISDGSNIFTEETDGYFLKITYTVGNMDTFGYSPVAPTITDSSGNSYEKFGSELFYLEDDENAFLFSFIGSDETETFTSIFEIESGSKNLKLNVSDESILNDPTESKSIEFEVR